MFTNDISSPRNPQNMKHYYNIGIDTEKERVIVVSNLLLHMRND